MFCSPGKAVGLFDLGWTLLPGIVAKLAWWRLHTWPEVDIHKALLFVAATKEAGDASAQVVAALCDLETWLPRPDAAGQPLFGLTPMLSDLSVGHRGCARGAGGHIGYKDINDELLHYPQLLLLPLPVVLYHPTEVADIVAGPQEGLPAVVEHPVHEPP